MLRLSLVAFMVLISTLVTALVGVKMWKSFLNGREITLWHSLKLEKVMLAFTALLILATSGLLLFNPMSKVLITYPLATDYPQNLMSPLSLETALTLKPELMISDKQRFNIYGIQIYEDQ